MSETGGLKAIEVSSFCWLSSNCNKIKEKTVEVWNCDKGRFSRRGTSLTSILVVLQLSPKWSQDENLTGINSVKPW